MSTKKKKKSKRKDSFFNEKKHYKKNKQAAENRDSWAFDETQDDLEMQSINDERTDTKIGLGKKIENGLHNVGELVEEKRDVIARTTKNLRNLKKMERGDAGSIVDQLIPQKVITRALGIVIGVYGFIGIISITLLILYCLDYFINTIYEEYTSYDYVFLYVMIGLCSIGALIGMYGTFTFGEIDEQMNILTEQNQRFKEKISKVDDNNDILEKSITAFQGQVDLIMDNKQDISSQIKAFERLENDLKLESKSNNKEIVSFLKQVQTLFRQFKTLQVQVEKANLLNLYYEYEFSDDDIAGLNQTEYNRFMARLDKQTVAKFKKFKDMDKNGDGTIDLNEFQTELDRIYKRMNNNVVLEVRKQDKSKNHQTKKNANQWKNWL